MSHNQKPCIDCQIPVANSEAFIRTNAQFQQVRLCKPCAEDRGWIVPAPRPPLDIVEVERYANQHAS